MPSAGRRPLRRRSSPTSRITGCAKSRSAFRPIRNFCTRAPRTPARSKICLLAIRRREGLIVLTGDIGTGKTTLCKAVLEQLDRKTFTTFVPDPFVTREALLKMLLLDFGVMSIDDLKSGRMTGASHPDLSYPLYDFLKSLVPLQAFAVLIIDEAQNLSSALLEEIRILSDLESPDKLLQVVLVGQLELRAKLKLPEMRQLDQRVSARCSLEPLSREGVAGYISHRLSVAGGADDRVHFSPDAIDAVFRVSGGTPRVVNLICDRALYRGHLARKNVIDLETVTQAIDDLGVGTLTPLPASLTAPADRHPIAPTRCAAALRRRRARRAVPAPLVRDSASHRSLRPRGARHRRIVHAPATIEHAGVLRHSIFGHEAPAPTVALALAALGGCRHRRGSRSCSLRFSARRSSSTTSRRSPTRTSGCLRSRRRRACPRRIAPVPIPADVTLRPPLPDAVRVEPGAPPPARE